MIYTFAQFANFLIQIVCLPEIWIEIKFKITPLSNFVCLHHVNFLNFSGTLINRKLIIQNLATFYSLSRNFIKFLFQRCWMLLLVLREELIWPYSKWRRRSRGAACSITFWLYYWWDFFVWNDGPRTEPQLWCHWGIGVGLKPKPQQKRNCKIQIKRMHFAV